MSLRRKDFCSSCAESSGSNRCVNRFLPASFFMFGRWSGLNRAKFPQLRQFSAMEACFLVLEPLFCSQIGLCSFARFAQRIPPIYLLKFTVQRFEQDRSAFWLQIPSANNTADRARTSVESFFGGSGALCAKTARDGQWSEAIAVGNPNFVEKVNRTRIQSGASRSD